MLPDNLDYAAITAISFEGRQRLGARRPRTLGDAQSLPGVTAADIETLWAVLQSRLR